MPRKKPDSDMSERDELVTLFQIGLLFCALLIGRELGNIYSNYGEVSKLSVAMQVSEEEMAGFIRGVLAGNDTDLNTEIGFTLPSFGNVQGQVTQIPDYVRRWFISVTLSAITVQQPEVSDIEMQLSVEGEPIQTSQFSFRREKVSYISYMNRTISLRIDDTIRFREAIRKASENHGGEIEITLTGRAFAHVAFFDVWLPFATTRYPFVRAPHINYLNSEWTNLDGSSIQMLKVGGRSYISVHLENPTRVHSIWENVTAIVYRDGSAEPISTVTKVVAAAPSNKVTYVFPFSPNKEGIYRYSLTSPGGFQVTSDQSQILEVEPS